MAHLKWRPVVAITVLVATFAVFANYFATHPAIKKQLSNTSPQIIIVVLMLYLLGIVALAGVTLATLRLCGIKLRANESLLLTAYSSVVNFFGPLQSGPAFRAVYLKAKHGVNLKNYATATLVYYFLYGSINGLLLLYGVFHWFVLLATLVFVGVAVLSIRHPVVNKRMQGIDLGGWYYLAAATLAQVIIVLFIYFIELHTINAHIRFGQAIVYTGAANLSLFVSITPGAIGFRESFLVFSQHLHHVNNSVIVAASILDRALYILLLLLLALFIFGSHASLRLLIPRE